MADLGAVAAAVHRVIVAAIEAVQFNELVDNQAERDEDGDYAVHTGKLADRITAELHSKGMLA